MKRLILLSVISAFVAASCTKDIHLNLKNASGLIVIEGFITNDSGPYYVVISKTITFYDSNTLVPVTGAKVIITDDAGNRDSLTSVYYPGLYLTQSIQGTVGRTYHLSVNVEGKQYDASSVMNPPVPVDSVGIQVFAFAGKQYWQSYYLFKDPPAISNYYNAFLYVNNKKQSKANPINDQLDNGLIVQAYASPDFFVNVNDTIQVELDAVDQPIYNYWYTLNNSTLGTLTAAPANPISNFSNNALGYFSAYSRSLSHHVVADQYGFHRID
jgi:hypothetical protein